MKFILTSIALVAALFTTGCEPPLRTLKPTEMALKFRQLPTFLGGGVSGSVIPGGQTVILMPWDQLYTFNSSVREVSWGPGKVFNEYINTRARDGNEVSLAVTVRYQLMTDEKSLVDALSRVAHNDAGVQEIVVNAARSDIRHYMNELRTAEFIDPQARVRAINKLQDSMEGRLQHYGVKVLSVSLEDFRFERVLPGGKTDDTYQERLDEIQKLVQETERERERVDTVVAQKQQVFNETQARVNRMVAEAQGELEQAKIRGENYLKARSNESQGILAKGKAEVQGMIEQINALAGPGGRALLRLDLAQQLAGGAQKFVVLNQQGAVNVQRTDVNELLGNIGLLEGLRDSPVEKKAGQDSPDASATDLSSK